MTWKRPLTRLEALEKAMQAPAMPHSICKMRTGETREIDGLSVLQPFMNGEIISVICDDADTAHLMRAIDTEKTVEIEIDYGELDPLRREKI